MNNGGLGWMWNNEISDEAKAHNCIKCGTCEKVCPQKIEIRKDLEKMEEEINAVLK